MRSGRFGLLLGGQLLLLVLEHHPVVNLILLALNIFECHRIPLNDTLHHLLCVPGPDRVVVAARV